MPIVSFAKMNVNRGSDQSASPDCREVPARGGALRGEIGRADARLLPGLSIDAGCSDKSDCPASPQP